MADWNNPEVEMETEEDRIYNETAANLMQEVSLPISSVTEPQFQAGEIPVSLPASVAIPEPTSSHSLPENADAEMQKRLDAVRSGFKTVEVEALGHRKPFPGGPVSMPASGSNVFTFGQNQAKDQTNAGNMSRPLSPTLKLYQLRHCQDFILESQLLQTLIQVNWQALVLFYGG